MDHNNSSTLSAKKHQFIKFNNADPYKKIRLIILFFIVLSTLSYWFIENKNNTGKSNSYITHPKINDVYYLDFRLLSNNLRPTEKYRLAKVVDVTGDVITLLYGNYFYLNERSMINGIRFGHLRFKDYFSLYRNNFTRQQLANMQTKGAIFKIERPLNRKLHGNFIAPQQQQATSKLFIPGRQENIQGESFLKATNVNNHLQLAFDYFKQSAQLNYPQGQINLAQMYLHNTLEQKDLHKALHWLKQASFQSSKSAINKYTIICQQVKTCDINNFYQDLIDEGVNIRFNKAIKPKFSLN